MRGGIERADVHLAIIYKIVRAAAIKCFVGVGRERIRATPV